MSSNKKRFALGWVLGVSFGLASSGVVYATGPITDTFATGGTLTAVQMNNIKNAVNDLQGNVPSTSCRTNAGLVDAGATRVGPLCVDTTRSAGSIDWSTAVETCRAAGKRLLTPGEYMAAKNQGVITALDGEFEWVDSVSHDGSVGGTAGRLTVAYMGPSVTLSSAILFSNGNTYDTDSFANVFFRCAR